MFLYQWKTNEGSSEAAKLDALNYTHRLSTGKVTLQQCYAYAYRYMLYAIEPLTHRIVKIGKDLYDRLV